MERLTKLKFNRHGNKKLIAIDGPPGTGKTNEILKRAMAWDEAGAVVTFTNAAAQVLKDRSQGEITAGTIYSLSWPCVKKSTGSKQTHGNKASGSWTKRKVKSTWDTALSDYTDAAPSKKGRTDLDQIASEIHSWDGTGDPPHDLKELNPVRELKYVLPLARWVSLGCPGEHEDKFPAILVDEAQDMSALEMAATLGLSDGKVTAFLDPGQSIFASAKGIGDALPPAWVSAAERFRLNGGHRIGTPALTTASMVLSSYFNRPPQTFTKTGVTTIVEPWEPAEGPPPRGLVLGYSRAIVRKYFELWDLEDTGLVPGQGNTDNELILSTIHSAKGSEAKDVYLLPWGTKALDKLELSEPNELRLLYVALTRGSSYIRLPWSIWTMLDYF